MLEIIFDLDKKNLRLEELDSIISEPGFWDDNVQAQIVLKEQSQIKNSLKEYDDLNKELEESVLLYEMAIEENDDSTAQEAKKMLFNLEKRLERLEFLRMMGGEDDSKNAILSINAGAGGTEAQDWAEMLLRMYLRYSERSGFKSEVVDIQDGDEAGIKSATILVSGDYS
ncbi:MAG: PCRF domain-containing protein, partial [Candidatus Dadabacteria bacterium]|nr:PCRF domain-containing protein [Candidatus Dadabacteria bacterium]NIQ16205.1 PCRF domain-containing protein [Candidatus Dadabacteria bacterium]